MAVKSRTPASSVAMTLSTKTLCPNAETFEADQLISESLELIVGNAIIVAKITAEAVPKISLDELIGCDSG
jgi:hypothetical protein